MSTPTWRRLQRLARRTVTPRAALGACAVVLAAAGAIVWAVQGSTPAPPSVAAPTTTTPSTSTRSHQSGPSSTTPSGHGTPSAVLPALGVYVGPAASSAAGAVSQQLGGKVTYVLDYLSDDSWTTITEPTWLADAWSGSPFHLELGVPMLPKTSQTGLAQGATGEYDTNFGLLAQRLVAGGLGDATLMVGWQPADPDRPWYVASAAEAVDYVTYWDDIESTMSAVTGAHFTFLWDVGDPGYKPPVSATAMYPGNAAVGIVATDAFDTAPSTLAATAQWPHVLAEPNGPGWLATFAASHHKPMAIAMWGESPTSDGGDGDVPQYVTGLVHWASGAGVQLMVAWDFGSAALTDGSFPSSLKALESAYVPATSSAVVRRPGPGRSTPAGMALLRAARSWDASKTGLGRATRSLTLEPQRGGAVRRGKRTVLRSLGSA